MFRAGGRPHHLLDTRGGDKMPAIGSCATVVTDLLCRLPYNRCCAISCWCIGLSLYWTKRWYWSPAVVLGCILIVINHIRVDRSGNWLFSPGPGQLFCRLIGFWNRRGIVGLGCLGPRACLTVRFFAVHPPIMPQQTAAHHRGGRHAPPGEGDNLIVLFPSGKRLCLFSNTHRSYRGSEANGLQQFPALSLVLGGDGIRMLPRPVFFFFLSTLSSLSAIQ